jgi:hypothetical protein
VLAKALVNDFFFLEETTSGACSGILQLKVSLASCFLSLLGVAKYF